MTFTAKTKGAITDREMGMFRTAVPSLAQTPEGNEQIIKTMRAGAQRVQQRAAFYERWLQQNGSMSGAQTAWNRYIEDNPLIEGTDNGFRLNPPADPRPYLIGGGGPSPQGSSAPADRRGGSTSNGLNWSVR